MMKTLLSRKNSGLSDLDLCGREGFGELPVLTLSVNRLQILPVRSPFTYRSPPLTLPRTTPTPASFDPSKMDRL